MARHLDWIGFWSCAVLLVSCSRIVSSSTVQPTEGTLQTSEAPLRSCYFYDSTDGRNRTCILTTPTGKCFSFIRRMNDGSFKLKRGCSGNCEDDHRNRKIQVCCPTPLCNTHLLTPDNFSSSSGATPQTTPTFGATSQMASTRSSSVTAAPSVTIKPIIIVPEQPSGDSSNDNEVNTATEATPQQPSTFLTCNCNQCGEADYCVGALCVASYDITVDNQLTLDTFCSNSTICPENMVCCNTDKCNTMVEIRDSQSTDIKPPSLSFTSDKTNIGTTTRATNISAQPAGDHSEKYFTIATVVSVVGGALVVGVVLFILAWIIFRFRRKTSSVKLLRQSSPPTMIGRNDSIIKPSPSPSYSLTSTATNSDSSNSHSNTTLSDSYKMDNPLKYLGTRV